MFSVCIRRVEIEVEMDDTKTRKSGGKTPAVELPRSSQNQA